MCTVERVAREVCSPRLLGQTHWELPRALVEVGWGVPRSADAGVGAEVGADDGRVVRSERCRGEVDETGLESNSRFVHTSSVMARPFLYLRYRDWSRWRRSNKERTHGLNGLNDVTPLSSLGEVDGQERAKAATLAERTSVGLQGGAVVTLMDGAQAGRNVRHFSVDHTHCSPLVVQAYLMPPYRAGV
jgi:hypothetical protein